MKFLRALAAWLMTPRVEPAPAPAEQPTLDNPALVVPDDLWGDFHSSEPGGKA